MKYRKLNFGKEKVKKFLLEVVLQGTVHPYILEMESTRLNKGGQ